MRYFAPDLDLSGMTKAKAKHVSYQLKRTRPKISEGSLRIKHLTEANTRENTWKYTSELKIMTKNNNKKKS